MKTKFFAILTALALFGMAATSFGATPSYADNGPMPTPTPLSGQIWDF
jgi:hypothetical protein